MSTYPDIELPDTLYELVAEAYPEDTALEADLHLMGVLSQVADRRHAQDQKWGGPEHDDSHSPDEWAHLLMTHTSRLCRACGEIGGIREKLIDVAALAVAAAQACDRHKHFEEDSHV